MTVEIIVLHEIYKLKRSAWIALRGDSVYATPHVSSRVSRRDGGFNSGFGRFRHGEG